MSETAVLSHKPWRRFLHRGDEHMQEVVGGAITAMLLKVVAAGLTFALSVVIARLLGAEGSGLYFLAFTIITVVATLSRVGMDNVVLRFIAAHAASGEWGKVRGIYRRSLLLAGIASMACGGGLFFGAGWVAERVFAQPALADPLRVMALAVPTLALFTLQAQALQGLKRIRDAIAVLSVWAPLFTLIAAPAAVYLAGVKGAAWSYAVAAFLTLGVGAWLWRRATPMLAAVAPDFAYRTILDTAGPLFVVAALQLVLNWGSALLIGIWCDSSTVGIFNAVVRTANLMTFVLVAVNSMVAPKFAALHHSGDTQALQNVARKSARLAAGCALPALVVLVVFPEWVMGLFGHQFTAGADAMRIVAIGQFVNVATGSVGYLLSMTGNEKILRNLMAGSAIMNVVLNVVLVPSMGLMGAAIAHGLTIGVQNLVAAYCVKKKLGFLTFGV